MAWTSRGSSILGGPSRKPLATIGYLMPLVPSLEFSSAITLHAGPGFPIASAREGRGRQHVAKKDVTVGTAMPRGPPGKSQFRGSFSPSSVRVLLLKPPSVHCLRGDQRCFSTHFLAELPPRVLLFLAKEIQQDAVVSARGGLEVPGLVGAVRRAQTASVVKEIEHHVGPLSKAPGRASISLEELWSQLIFLLHGRLHQLHPEDLCFLLEVLAAAGPLALRHAHRSHSGLRASGSRGEEEGPHTVSPGPLEGHEPANRDRKGGLAGNPQWRPDIIGEIEALLMSQACNISLSAVVAAVNSPQILLYPLLQLPHRFLSPRGTATTGSSKNCMFLELLQPLIGPLSVIASDSPVEKASAYHKVGAAVGKGPDASVAGGLIELWHAALSLNLHIPLLSAVTLREAEESFPLLPLSSVLLLLRSCCMHLTASSLIYESLPALHLPLPHAGDSLQPHADAPKGSEGTHEADGPVGTSMWVASLLLLRAADRLAQNHGETVDKLLEMLLRRVPEMRIEELIATLRALRSLGVHDAELMQNASRQLAENGKDCPLFLLIEALDQLHLLGQRNPELCIQIAGRPPEEHFSLGPTHSARLRHSLEEEGITLALPKQTAV